MFTLNLFINVSLLNVHENLFKINNERSYEPDIIMTLIKS